jgi:chromosome partitioning protein
VAAAPVLFGAEFALPARQTQEPGFEFWRVLDLGIDDVRDEYDVIIIDTPPAPVLHHDQCLHGVQRHHHALPPNALDFASASQFWSLFSDLTAELLTNRGLTKEFDFIHILLARVDSTDAASNIVRQWIGQTYAEKVLPVEIPKTAVTGVTAAEFGNGLRRGEVRRIGAHLQARTRCLRFLRRAHRRLDPLGLGQAGRRSRAGQGRGVERFNRASKQGAKR